MEALQQESQPPSTINNEFEKKDFKSGYKKLISDNSVIKALGYKPEVSFHDLAKMMMNND